MFHLIHKFLIPSENALAKALCLSRAGVGGGEGTAVEARSDIAFVVTCVEINCPMR
jgi:hypothetical protein